MSDQQEAEGWKDSALALEQELAAERAKRIQAEYTATELAGLCDKTEKALAATQAVLRKIEWRGDGAAADRACPCCDGDCPIRAFGREPGGGHIPGCELAAALADAAPEIAFFDEHDVLGRTTKTLSAANAVVEAAREADRIRVESYGPDGYSRPIGVAELDDFLSSVSGTATAQEKADRALRDAITRYDVAKEPAE